MTNNPLTRTQVMQARQSGRLTSSQTVDLLRQIREDPSSALQQAQQFGILDTPSVIIGPAPEFERGLGPRVPSYVEPTAIDPVAPASSTIASRYADQAKQLKELAAYKAGRVPSTAREVAVEEASKKLDITARTATYLLTATDLSDSSQEAKKTLQEALGDVPSERDWLGKAADITKEIATLGKAETQTFNIASMELEYDEVKSEYGRLYIEAVAKAEADGLEVTESEGDYLQRVLPSKAEYVQNVLEMQPQLTSIAKEFGLASIPIYGTIRTWQDSPNWAKALSVAGDLAFFIPIVGQVSAASRAGTSLLRTGANIAIAEVRAPITTVLHPLKTAKLVLEPLETIFIPRKIPVEALEVSFETIRIPTALEVARTPSTVKMPGGLLTPEEAFKVREALTQAAIRGESPRIPVGTAGEVQITSPAFQKTIGIGAIHNTPDARNFMTGITVGEDGSGVLFLAPGRMERFVQATGTGITEFPLSVKAEAARRLGQIPDQPISGSVLIRDPELLSKLQDSGKLWKGAAEIETVLPEGTVIPPPSQVLYTRSAYTGERSAILVIGKPLNPLEIAKLKLVGPVETVKAIFRPSSGKFTAYSDDLVEASLQGKRASDLYEQAEQAKAVDNLADATRLEREADAIFLRADKAFARANLQAGVANLAVEPVVVYTGDQDISEAFRTLETPTRVNGRVRSRVVLEEEPTPTATRFRGEEESPRADEVVSARPDRAVDEALRLETPIPPPSDRPIRPEDTPERPVRPTRSERPERPTRPRLVVPLPTKVLPPKSPGVPLAALPRGPKSKRPAREGDRKDLGVAWKQGNLWVALYPPYTEEDILLSPTAQPPNTRKVKNPKEAWTTILKDGYNIDASVYDEWAAWFSPERDVSIDIKTDLAVETPQEGGGIPIGYKTDYWWSP
ncbi:hypothetical protein LCGC14_1182460 [marine sediment metagenome]|uniref:Uncharacterized protein n=1 Tax=marine sediment metagenome TaxID=412755 RepID=A0A0F9M9F7_9ZZZZ